MWWFQFSCCGAVGPQDFQYSAWYNRSNVLDVTRVYVPGSCCVDSPTYDSSGNPVKIYAESKVSNCQQSADRYIRYINNLNGPDPTVGSLHFLQTQVGAFGNRFAPSLQVNDIKHKCNCEITQ